MGSESNPHPTRKRITRALVPLMGLYATAPFRQGGGPMQFTAELSIVSKIKHLEKFSEMTPDFEHVTNEAWQSRATARVIILTLSLSLSLCVDALESVCCMDCESADRWNAAPITIPSL